MTSQIAGIDTLHMCGFKVARHGNIRNTVVTFELKIIPFIVGTWKKSSCFCWECASKRLRRHWWSYARASSCAATYWSSHSSSDPSQWCNPICSL